MEELEKIKNRIHSRRNYSNEVDVNVIEMEKAYSKPSKLYKLTMDCIQEARNNIKEMLLDDGIDEKQAVEDSNYVLPRATNLTLTIGFTPEALIHFMHKRLCVRAQEPIRKVALLMKKAVAEILPECAKQLIPHCQYLLWCPEGKNMTCGAYPRREELLAKLSTKKEE